MICTQKKRGSAAFPQANTPNGRLLEQLFQKFFQK
jgi:hypothetical protein